MSKRIGYFLQFSRVSLLDLTVYILFSVFSGTHFTSRRRFIHAKGSRISADFQRMRTDAYAVAPFLTRDRHRSENRGAVSAAVIPYFFKIAGQHCGKKRVLRQLDKYGKTLRRQTPVQGYFVRFFCRTELTALRFLRRSYQSADQTAFYTAGG